MYSSSSIYVALGLLSLFRIYCYFIDEDTVDDADDDDGRGRKDGENPRDDRCIAPPMP